VIAVQCLPARIGAGGLYAPGAIGAKVPGAVTTVPPTAKLPCSWMTKATMWCWRVVHWVRRSGALEQKRQRIPGELSIGAKDQNRGHSTPFQRPTIFCSCSG
jgi:hypothetical protein